MVGIYKITSPTGKVYIGQSWRLEKRLNAYRNLECLEQAALFNSLKKHGPRSHIFEIVHELPSDVNQTIMDNYELFYWEQHLGCEYEMLNIREPGNGRRHAESTKLKIKKALTGLKRNQETIEKMKQAMMGKKMSEEARLKAANSRRGEKNCNYGKDFSGEKNAFFGRSHSDETKRKQSELKKGLYLNEKNPFFGKRHDDETRKKMKAGQFRRRSQAVGVIPYSFGHIFNN